MVGGLGDVAQQSVEHLVAVGEDIDAVVLERESPVLERELLHQGAMLLRDGQVFLLHILKHGALGELVEAVL